MATIGQNKAALRKGYLASTHLMGLMAMPASVGLVLVAPIFVTVAMGSAWAPISPLMQVIALYGLLNSLAAPVVSVLLAAGRADATFKFSLWRTMSLVTVIVPGAFVGGTIGVALSVTLVGALTLVWSFQLAKTEVSVSLREIGAVLRLPAYGTSLMAVAVIVWQQIVANTTLHHSSLLVLSTTLTIGIVSYGAALWLISRGSVVQQVRDLIGHGVDRTGKIQ
jgi:O-antigen/teichoic acid export membrane protein